MKRFEAVGLGVIIIALLVSGTGLAYIGLTDEATANGSPQPTVDTTTPTTTTSTSAPTTTKSPTHASVVGESVMNVSHNRDDGGVMVEYRVTGENWSVNIYRSGESLTTIVPEEHTDSTGKTHPTSSYWNNNSSLPDSKNYALVGSRIVDGTEGSSVETEYVVTVVLPAVHDETVRFTRVKNGAATTFFKATY